MNNRPYITGTRLESKGLSSLLLMTFPGGDLFRQWRDGKTVGNMVALNPDDVTKILRSAL